MKRRWLLLVVMTVSLLLLSACTPSDKTLILAPTPAQTHDAAFDPAIEDIDFASCTEPMELVPFSPYEWELPLEIVPNSMLEEAQLTQPVEIACALINLGGVLFVATDEGGRQFIGGFPLDEWGYERLYTLPEGMRVTSLVQTKEYGRYNETGAFSWT